MKKMKRIISFMIALICVFASIPFSVGAVSVTDFKDLDKNADYYEAVSWAVQNGYMSGMSSNTFSPDTVLTRVQFATLMAKFSGDDISGYGGQIFEDVSASNWCVSTVAWAYNNGIMSGTSTTKLIFSPDVQINRQTIALLIKNYLSYKGIHLEKVTEEVRLMDRGTKRTDSWASEAVDYAYKTDYMQLDSNNCFNPKNLVTRGEAAVVLYSLNSAIERLSADRDRKVVAYLSEGAYSENEFEYVDILNIIPMRVSGQEFVNGSENFINTTYIDRVNKLRKAALSANPNMKFGLTLTSNSGEDIEKCLYPYSNCERFADKVVELVAQYGYDGVDFDYEFPTGNLPQKNLEYFLSVLRQKLDELGKTTGKDYFVTMAIPGGLYSFSLYEDLAELQHYVDFFNYMDYDLMIGSARTTAYSHCAVYSAGYGYATFDDIVRSIEEGVQREKIVIGAGTYLQGWSNVEGRYDEKLGIWIGLYGQGLWKEAESRSLVSVYDLINYENNEPISGYYTYFDEGTHTVSLYNPGTKYFISCDEDWSLEEKCRLINEYNIGGLMIFTYNHSNYSGVLEKIDGWLK